MKKFLFGMALFFAGLACGFILLLVSIKRDLESHIQIAMFLFFLLSAIGSCICIYECYFKKEK